MTGIDPNALFYFVGSILLGVFFGLMKSFHKREG